MKILFFYQYFGTPQGSWSTRVYEFCRRWVDEGHKVTVVTAPYEKSDIKASGFIHKTEIDGIKVIIINSKDSNRLSLFRRGLQASIFSVVSLWFVLISKFDVCIASSGPITIGLPMIFAKKIRKKKTIFEVRDLWPAGGIEMGKIKHEGLKKIALWFEKQCYRSSDLVITASIGQQSHILKRFPSLKTAVIPNASDIELFSNSGDKSLPFWADKKILFTHIGSLGFIHNIDYWMKVAGVLKQIDTDARITLVFIGDGKDRKRLVEEAENLDLENIKFIGLLPKSDLPEWVHKSCATLFATLDNEVQNTCSPNKIFDSFAAGIPIIQTSTGWIYDLVEEEKCGINVPLSSPKIAAEKMLHLADNPLYSEKMGENAFRLAETMFNRDRLATKYLELIQSFFNE